MHFGKTAQRSAAQCSTGSPHQCSATHLLAGAASCALVARLTRFHACLVHPIAQHAGTRRLRHAWHIVLHAAAACEYAWRRLLNQATCPWLVRCRMGGWGSAGSMRALEYSTSCMPHPPPMVGVSSPGTHSFRVEGSSPPRRTCAGLCDPFCHFARLPAQPPASSSAHPLWHMEPVGHIRLECMHTYCMLHMHGRPCAGS